MALESVVIGGAKRVVGCSSRTCNEAVRGDMGLDSLQGRRDTAKLKCGIKAGVFCTGVECYWCRFSSSTYFLICC